MDFRQAGKQWQDWPIRCRSIVVGSAAEVESGLELGPAAGVVDNHWRTKIYGYMHHFLWEGAKTKLTLCTPSCHCHHDMYHLSIWTIPEPLWNWYQFVRKHDSKCIYEGYAYTVHLVLVQFTMLAVGSHCTHGLCDAAFQVLEVSTTLAQSLHWLSL